MRKFSSALASTYCHMVIMCLPSSDRNRLMKPFRSLYRIRGAELSLRSIVTVHIIKNLQTTAKSAVNIANRSQQASVSQYVNAKFSGMWGGGVAPLAGITVNSITRKCYHGAQCSLFPTRFYRYALLFTRKYCPRKFNRLWFHRQNEQLLLSNQSVTRRNW